MWYANGMFINCVRTLDVGVVYLENDSVPLLGIVKDVIQYRIDHIKGHFDKCCGCSLWMSHCLDPANVKLDTCLVKW